MISLAGAIDQVVALQVTARKPPAIILAGHNGSGKSTMWYGHVASTLRMPLVNADRMMMSILPEAAGGHLPPWASELRDNDQTWMRVAQKGVQAFVVQAMAHGVPFAMETVFSHWVERPTGRVDSKIQLIEEMQLAGYFTILLFVGLSDVELSIARVATRMTRGGHGVAVDKLVSRFPRTQKAVGAALGVADAVILMDNSRTVAEAFAVCRVQARQAEIFDIRDQRSPPPLTTLKWLDIVSPRPSAAGPGG